MTTQVSKKADAFDNASYYDCDIHAERLSYESVDEAIAGYLDEWAERGQGVLDQIRCISPLTVTAFNPMTIDASRVAQWAAEWIDESLSEDYADPDGPSLFEGEPQKKLAQGIKAVIADVLSEVRVWACEPVATRVYDAQAIERMIREYAPHWFKEDA